MSWTKEAAASAIAEALRMFVAAAKEAGAQTVPATPLPRLPKNFARWAWVGQERMWYPGDDPRLMRGVFHPSWDMKYFPDGVEDKIEKWAYIYAHLCGHKPAKVARLVARIRADTVWLRRSVEARRRMAEEIVRQQSRHTTSLAAEAVAWKL